MVKWEDAAGLLRERVLIQTLIDATSGNGALKSMGWIEPERDSILCQHFSNDPIYFYRFHFKMEKYVISFNGCEGRGDLSRCEST